MTPDRHGEIAECAYRIWESEGKPSGRETEHWLRAEAEVTARHLETASAKSEAPAPPKRPEAPPAASPVKLQRSAPRRARRTQQ